MSTCLQERNGTDESNEIKQTSAPKSLAKKTAVNAVSHPEGGATKFCKNCSFETLECVLGNLFAFD